MTDRVDLSERELEILKLVATGASNKEIAQQLYISPNTVKVHLKNIFAKIGAASRTEAAMYVVQQGLFQPATPGEGASAPDIAGPSPAEAGNLGEGVETEKASRLGRAFPGWTVVGALLLFTLLGLLIFLQQRQGLGGQPSLAATDTPRWSARSSLPTPRFGLASAVYGESVFAIAGESDQGVSDTVEKYEPDTDQWTTLASKPLPVTDANAAVLAGKIFVPGGRTASGEVTDRVEIYDPLEDSWTEGVPLPAPMSAYALAVFEGKLYVFGGWDGEKYLRSVYEYDPDREVWTERASMPTARGFAGAEVAGRTIYVIGGDSQEGALPVNEAYLPDLDNGSDNPWQIKAELPEPRYAFGIASIADTISVLGGKGEGLEEYQGLVYLPASDEWQQIEAPQAPVGYGLELAASGPYLYLLGGILEGSQDEEISGAFYVYRVYYTVSFPVIEK
jgi:DNA-binding CsgD family transcriptional regulator/N-acetylneuraminic acid mutarotase